MGGYKNKKNKGKLTLNSLFARLILIITHFMQEMTIKGIEPELNRMSIAYQEELSELRRIHQSQIEEIEATWHRRMATMRDKMDAEREQAVVTERENSRNRYNMPNTFLLNQFDKIFEFFIIHKMFLNVDCLRF